MATNSLGVKLLLSAEKRAEEKINAARKNRIILLKQARGAAILEVEKYRYLRAEQYKIYEAQCDKKAESMAKLAFGVQGNLDAMNAHVQQNKGKVIDMLLAETCHVVPQLHRNFRYPPPSNDNSQ